MGDISSRLVNSDHKNVAVEKSVNAACGGIESTTCMSSGELHFRAVIRDESSKKATGHTVTEHSLRHDRCQIEVGRDAHIEVHGCVSGEIELEGHMPYRSSAMRQ